MDVGNAGESAATPKRMENEQSTEILVLKPGEVFADRYVVEREVGRGGFGIVYAAFDRGPLKRTVALKVIRFTSNAPGHAEASRRGFLDEARLAGSLSHPNIATVYDAGESAGCVYLTQEFVSGQDLRRLIKETGAVPVRQTVDIVHQVCEGLAHAHSQGIVHCDIKPANIILDDQNRVKITDFGLAKSGLRSQSGPRAEIAGTPGYMAPEQLRGEQVDARADIFAAGCVLYEVLVGQRPFAGATVASIVQRTLDTCPPDPSCVREDLPRAMDRIVSRAMRKNPVERYEHIALLAQDLLNFDRFEYCNR